MTQVADPAATSERATTRLGRRAVIVAVVLLAMVLAVVFLATREWPFSAHAMLKKLSEASGDRVTVAKFREFYFPHPGCIAEGVTFQRDPSSPRLTVTRLTIEGSYLGLLHHYIPRMTAVGARLTVPEGGLGKLASGAGQPDASTTVGEIDLPHATVEIATAQRGTLVFQFDELRFESVSQTDPFRFHATLRNPVPTGDLRIDGQAGPFHHGSVPQSPISGKYLFSNANLDAFPGVAGAISSQGNFNGQLQAIHVDGAIDSPGFLLDHVQHPVDLQTQFHVVVNGTNGDLKLDSVQSHYGETTIATSGAVSNDATLDGKTASLDMSSSTARIQDLLRLFVRSDPPAAVGAITLHAHVVLPPEDRSFLKRLQIDGDFVMPNAQSSNPDTQKNIDLLSARARGQADKMEDDKDRDRKKGTNTLSQELQRVDATVKGRLTLRDGVARFSSLTFEVPGATAQLAGTYNLLNQEIDLHGTMHLQTRLSHATTGVKSFLAKLIQPMTHKPGESGADVTVRVTGTYRHPSFAVVPTTGGK